MATIKFSDYPRLKRAVAQAKYEVRKAEDNPVERTLNVRYAEQRLDQIETMLDLYDFGRHGAIYIDSGEVSLIKRFTE